LLIDFATSDSLFSVNAGLLGVALAFVFRRRGPAADDIPSGEVYPSGESDHGLMEVGDFATMDFDFDHGDSGRSWHERQWQESNLADWFRHRSVELADRAARREKSRVK
jgi:hypothetical protein